MYIYQQINVTRDGSAAILTINRPESLNALNKGVFDDLDHFFTEGYKEFDGIGGVVITGAGEKAFAAGADIKEFLDHDGAGMSKLSRRGQLILFKIERFHLPVVAAVNGFSLGGGNELAMACHIRLASENAKFGQPEVNLAIIPGYGGTQRLAQLVGKGKAMELILTGDMIDATEAHRIGLVNHVFSQDELMPAALKMISKMARKGPLAIAISIDCINQAYEDGVDGYLKESREFGNIADTNDFMEGATAFNEKRKPNFTGS